MEVLRIVSSCNKSFLRDEKTVINPKASKLKKNRMQAKNEAIQNYTIGLVDISLRKEKRKQTALNRRANS